ncbi:MAG TPA: TIGR04282 family arsenosugar biosynthesis glycosyltransferase [Gemmatimonadota bacterium]|nr:TIGR04282 family arsenosugar biosynthesis glycosyltransferase [Gemmatimonadota bacterium]
MTRAPRPQVAVFARAPEPGRVKTRLIPILHAAEAAELYEALLLDTIEVAESCARTVIAFTPSGGRGVLDRLLGRHRRLLPQGPGDLGERLARVFEILCEKGQPALVVGSDCPGLTPARIRAAAERLAHAEVVLGPALDGGYYLIGLRRPHPELFRDIPWGTGAVLEATVGQAREAGLELELLEVARDLDTPEDLYEWYAGSRSEEFAANYPRTWRALHALLPPARFATLEESIGERSGP